MSNALIGLIKLSAGRLAGSLVVGGGGYGHGESLSINKPNPEILLVRCVKGIGVMAGVVAVLVFSSLLLAQKEALKYSSTPSRTSRLPNDYFEGARKIVFCVSKKEINNVQSIRNILRYLDMSGKRTDYCAFIPLYIDVTLRDGTVVSIALNPVNWWFRGDGVGHTRTIINEDEFKQMYYDLMDEYGPLSK